MNFFLRPSLEYIALVKVAATLWNEQDIRALLVELQDDNELSDILPSETTEKWQTIKKKVAEKIPQLGIPTSLKEKLLGYIQPVGLHILNWMDYHQSYCCFDFYLPREFYWMPQGTVDRKKTAEAVIKDESIDIIARFKLACIYCLEEDVMELWSKISKNCKKSFYKLEKRRNSSQMQLLIFWKDYAAAKCGVAREINSELYEQMLQFAADTGNKAAVEYFLKKLTPRKETLAKTALHVLNKREECLNMLDEPPKEYFNELFCSLLSHMNKEQQEELFENCPFNVLLSFLEWPLQSLFVDAAIHLWRFLSEEQFGLLLKKIIYNIITGCRDTDYVYREMLHGFLQQIPPAHENFLINDFDIEGLVEELLLINDTESIKLIIQHTALKERHKLIFSKVKKIVYLYMLMYTKWDLLRFFLKQFISTQDEMRNFIHEFKEHFTHIQQEVYGKVDDKMIEFFESLEDIIREYDKRKIVDEIDSSSTKRLCN